MKDVLVITGPTAVGKTTVGIQVAKTLDGEIISADSMQIYKGMDIGTAKPTAYERKAVPHHMIDIVDPSVRYNVAQYKTSAQRSISDVIDRGKVPIVVGGTGLYIKALADHMDFGQTPGTTPHRARLYEQARKQGNESLHEKLHRLDPKAAATIHVNDTKRLVRALEVCCSGQIYTKAKEKVIKRNPQFRFTIYCLTMDRQRLYEKIRARVDDMIESGLPTEARRLFDEKTNRDATALMGIGYKEFFAYFRGLATFDETVATIKRESTRYAKRQITWMKRIDGVKMLDLDSLGTDQVVSMMIQEYQNKVGKF